jgi:hypothetical protein
LISKDPPPIACPPVPASLPAKTQVLADGNTEAAEVLAVASAALARADDRAELGTGSTVQSGWPGMGGVRVP